MRICSYPLWNFVFAFQNWVLQIPWIFAKPFSLKTRFSFTPRFHSQLKNSTKCIWVRKINGIFSSRTSHDEKCWEEITNFILNTFNSERNENIRVTNIEKQMFSVDSNILSQMYCLGRERTLPTKFLSEHENSQVDLLRTHKNEITKISCLYSFFNLILLYNSRFIWKIY